MIRFFVYINYIAIFDLAIKNATFFSQHIRCFGILWFPKTQLLQSETMCLRTTVCTVAIVQIHVVVRIVSIEQNRMINMEGLTGQQRTVIITVTDNYIKINTQLLNWENKTFHNEPKEKEFFSTQNILAYCLVLKKISCNTVFKLRFL